MIFTGFRDDAKDLSFIVVFLGVFTKVTIFFRGVCGFILLMDWLISLSFINGQ